MGFDFPIISEKNCGYAKKIVRIIMHAPYNSHTHELFNQLNILKFADIYNLYLGKYMFKQLNDLLPKPLLHKYTACSNVHSHNTRCSNLLHKQSRRTVIVSNSFINRGPDYWNGLPVTLKDSSNFSKQHRLYLSNA